MVPTTATLTIATGGLPIVGLGQLLTFVIRMVFLIAGLAALIYGLLGGIAWITSSGEKEKIQAARDKIQAAIVGIFILVLVLTIIWTIEQLVFNRTVCFGISCDATIPSLVGKGSSSGSGGPTIPRRDQFDALCKDYCGFSRVGYSDGYCGNTSQDRCDQGGAYVNPEPASEDRRCMRGGREGPCCCF